MSHASSDPSGKIRIVRPWKQASVLVLALRYPRSIAVTGLLLVVLIAMWLTLVTAERSLS
jgi:hypothetical protein